MQRWHEFHGNDRINTITSQQLISYMAWLGSEYKPQRFNGSEEPLSRKTLRNHWITLSGFFRWASEEFEVTNPMKRVPSPRYEVKPVEPLTKNEVQSLLKASEYSRIAIGYKPITINNQASNYRKTSG